MTYQWSDESKSMRTISNFYRPARFGRLRRPLFLAVCVVCFIVWHRSTSAQSSLLSQYDALGHLSFRNTRAHTPSEGSNPPDSIPDYEQAYAEEFRRREALRRQEHLELDQLQ